MKFTNRVLTTGVLVLFGTLFLPGCGESEPDTPGDAVDGLLKDAEKAVDDAKDKADDAKKKAEKAAEENR